MRPGMIGRLHGPLYILNLNNTDILMRSMTSENEQKDILHRTRVPINCFPIDRPELSVDLFKYITAGEAIRLDGAGPYGGVRADAGAADVCMGGLCSESKMLRQRVEWYITLPIFRLTTDIMSV